MVFRHLKASQVSLYLLRAYAAELTYWFLEGLRGLIVRKAWVININLVSRRSGRVYNELDKSSWTTTTYVGMRRGEETWARHSSAVYTECGSSTSP